MQYFRKNILNLFIQALSYLFMTAATAQARSSPVNPRVVYHNWTKTGCSEQNSNPQQTRVIAERRMA